MSALSDTPGLARRCVSILAALVVAIAGVVVTGTAAMAAEVSGHWANITVTNGSGQTPQPYERVRVDAEWSIDVDDAVAGNTFSLAWDSHLQPYEKSFTVRVDPQDPNSPTIANCVATQGDPAGAGKITCTLTDYAAEHPNDLHGTVWVEARQVEVHRGQSVTVVFEDNGVAHEYSWTPEDRTPFEGLGYSKRGRLATDGTVRWTIYLPAGEGGLARTWHNVAVTDTFVTPMELVSGPTLRRSNTLDESGTWPVWSDAPSSLWSADTDMSGSMINGFTLRAPQLQAGWHYMVELTTRVDPNAPAGTVYGNRATTSADEKNLGETSYAVKDVDAGGAGSGQGSINLRLTKQRTSAAVTTPGQQVVFELVPSNEGPGDAIAGWSVTDVMPQGLELIGMSGTGYTCTLTTATCVAGDGLGAGATGAPVTVTARVTAGFTGTAKNVAYVSPDSDDVVETNPLGTPPTTETDTTDSPTDNDDQVGVTVEQALVRVGDHVWFDTDHDGVQDSGENGIEGVTLTLHGPDGKVIATTRTDADGQYLFPSLPALPAGQHYTVRVTTPAGHVPTVPGRGSRATDSSTGSAESIDLTRNGAEDLTLDFGFWVPAPAISVDKRDIAGRAADTAADSADLGVGRQGTGIVITVRNTGEEALLDVVVSDTTTGSGQVRDLSCTFPDGSTGVRWAGPFRVGASFPCTARLSGVVPGEPHRDVVHVEGTGAVTGQVVTDSNAYHAVTHMPNLPTTGGSTPPPSTHEPKQPKQPKQPKPHRVHHRPQRQLPVTGLQGETLLSMGTLMAGAGVLLLVAGRRRREQQD